MSKEPFIVINPNANSGRLGKKIDKILQQIKDQIGDFEYAITEKPEHEKELAKKAIEDGYKVLIALGGDGTATNMGDVVVDHPEITLGLLSAGSMCDWHQTHSIPFNLEESLAILAEGHTEKFPAVKCTGDKEQYAFDMADGGFTGKAAAAAHYEMKWMKIGLIKYNWLAVKYVIKTKNTPCIVTIDDREPIRVEELTNYFAGFGDYITGFYVMPGNPFYSEKNKDLGMGIVHGMKGLKRLSMLVKAIPGNHVGIKGAWFTRGRKIVVESERDPLCSETEGEIFNENSLKVTMERVDDAITLIVPKEREYPVAYDESYYGEKFEDSFEERKYERIDKD